MCWSMKWCIYTRKGFRDRMDMYLPDWRSRRHAINQYTIY